MATVGVKGLMSRDVQYFTIYGLQNSTAFH